MRISEITCSRYMHSSNAKWQNISILLQKSYLKCVFVFHSILHFTHLICSHIPLHHWYKFYFPEFIVCLFVCLFVCLMVLNATFNNISVISWRSVLLVEETGGPRENHRSVASHWQTLSHNVAHLPRSRFEFTTSVVIGTDCIGSCKSNYHTITATTSEFKFFFHYQYQWLFYHIFPQFKP